ncbi:hypothetical protein [Uliginosibacterium sp. TH139]|uniref:hypothetical protein n=1 Tax=Uliginosibacterium sp. TH139 TaxID=2067453 RepID=UPI001C1FD182|nr:hypothetical protein [Uliginosibacterium sp. TH139]
MAVAQSNGSNGWRWLNVSNLTGCVPPRWKLWIIVLADDKSVITVKPVVPYGLMHQYLKFGQCRHWPFDLDQAEKRWLASRGGASEQGCTERLDVIHAWLVEDLPGGRVCALTQESQKGKPVQALATSKPNIMIKGHQDWRTGLVEATCKTKAQ